MIRVVNSHNIIYRIHIYEQIAAAIRQNKPHFRFSSTINIFCRVKNQNAFI